MTPSTDTATLIDQARVIDTLNRMAWYEDRQRWTELEDLWADEIQVGYGEHPDVELVTLSRGDLIANWRSGLEHTSSLHILNGITVDAVGDTAHATLNETASTQGETADGLSLYQFGTAMECALRRAPAGGGSRASRSCSSGAPATQWSSAAGADPMIEPASGSPHLRTGRLPPTNHPRMRHRDGSAR